MSFVGAIRRSKASRTLKRINATQQIASLFGTNDTGYFYDSSVPGTLFQDSAGTVPVTGSGQPIGFQRDISGKNNHRTQTTSLQRPQSLTINGNLAVSYNGVDQSLNTAGTVNFTATDKVTIGMGVRKIADNPETMILESSPVVNSNPGSYAVFNSFFPDNNYSFFLSQNVGVNIVRATQYVPPLTNVIVNIYDLSGATALLEIIPRINRLTPTLTAAGAAEAGANNFGNYTVYFASRNGASFFFQGYNFVDFAISRRLTLAEIILLESYIANRCSLSI